MLIDFLSTLDGRVAREIYNDKEFSGYTKDVDRETELLIPYPYQDIYLRWLEAMIDKNNEEMTSFNNNMAMFNADFENYANYYNRNKPSDKSHFKYF